MSQDSAASQAIHTLSQTTDLALAKDGVFIDRALLENTYMLLSCSFVVNKPFMKFLFLLISVPTGIHSEACYTTEQRHNVPESCTFFYGLLVISSRSEVKTTCLRNQVL